MALAITWTNADKSLWLCDISLESIFTENAQDSVWNNDELFFLRTLWILEIWVKE